MNNEINRFQYSICCKSENDIFFFTRYYSMLMKLNLTDYKMEYVKDSKGRFLPFKDCADGIIIAGHIVYQLNNGGKSVLKFDMNAGTYRELNIDCGCKPWGNYAAYADYLDKLYIFPRYRKDVIVIDKNTDEVKYDDSVKDKLKESKGYDEEMYWSQGCRKGDSVWLISNDGKIAISYSLIENKISIYNLPIDIQKCSHFVVYDDLFYILDYMGNVYTWDTSEEKLLFSIPDVNYGECGRLVLTDKNIYVLPSIGNDILIYDKKNGTVREYTGYPDDFEYSIIEDWSKYYGYCEDEKNYYYAMRLSNYIPVIDKTEGQIQWIKPIFPDFKESYAIYGNAGDKLYDEKMFSLDEYLDAIVSM